MPAQRHSIHTPDVGRALWETAAILREVADFEADVDAHRGQISASVAELLTACGSSLGALPPAVVTRALAVAQAVNRATGSRTL